MSSTHYFPSNEKWNLIFLPAEFDFLVSTVGSTIAKVMMITATPIDSPMTSRFFPIDRKQELLPSLLSENRKILSCSIQVTKLISANVLPHCIYHSLGPSPFMLVKVHEPVQIVLWCRSWVTQSRVLLLCIWWWIGWDIGEIYWYICHFN